MTLTPVQELQKSQWSFYMGKFFVDPGFTSEEKSQIASRFLSEVPVQLHVIFPGEAEYLRLAASILLLRFPGVKITYREADLSLVSDQYFERGALDYLISPELVLIPHSRFLRANSATLPALGAVFDRRLGKSFLGYAPVTLYASFSSGDAAALPGIESVSFSDLVAGREGVISSPVSLGGWGGLSLPVPSGSYPVLSGSVSAPAEAGSIPVPAPRV